MNRSDLSESKSEKAKLLQVDPGHKTLYKAGGILLILGGIFYLLVTLAALTPGTNGWAEPPFVSAATFINAMATHARAAYFTWTFFTLVDFIAVPVMVALYFALKGVNRDALIVGIGVLLMSVILDAAVAEVGFFTATSLSVSYATATDPVLKAAYYVAAQHAVLQTEFAWPYSYFTGFAGWLIISAVMRRSFAFGKWVGGFGVIASALFLVDMGLVYTAPAVAGNLILPLQLAFVVFYVLAGSRLLGLGRRLGHYTSLSAGDIPPRQQQPISA
jgi:hypothetical protein